MGSTEAKDLRKLYDRARQRLLTNAPLLAHASESSVDVAMSAGEIHALNSVGLSVTP
jgi:hypothetical protein